jgi:hypothetical protein
MRARAYIRVPYKDVEWVWIADHYDIHLGGLARHKGELMRFETPGFYWSTRRRLSPVVRLYRLSWAEKAVWLRRKRTFEVCVGRHWTYPDRRLGHRSRKPRWLREALSWLYYRLKRV